MCFETQHHDSVLHKFMRYKIPKPNLLSYWHWMKDIGDTGPVIFCFAIFEARSQLNNERMSKANHQIPKRSGLISWFQIGSQKLEISLRYHASKSIHEKAGYLFSQGEK